MRGDPSARTESGGDGRPAAGWYPDYAAPSGHERYWDGRAWTELTRAAESADEPQAADARRELGARVLSAVSLRGAGVTLLVLAVLAAVVVLAERDSGDPDAGGAAQTVSQPADGEGPDDAPPGEDGSADAADGATGPDDSSTGTVEGTVEVTDVEDPLTLVLRDDVAVRLVGVDAPVGACAAAALTVMDELVRDRDVVLVRRGADRDAEGHLLRYVERDGVDVGMRLIQRGLATASDEAHARAAKYRRVQARATPAC